MGSNRLNLEVAVTQALECRRLHNWDRHKARAVRQKACQRAAEWLRHLAETWPECPHPVGINPRENGQVCIRWAFGPAWPCVLVFSDGQHYLSAIGSTGWYCPSELIARLRMLHRDHVEASRG